MKPSKERPEQIEVDNNNMPARLEAAAAGRHIHTTFLLTSTPCLKTALSSAQLSSYLSYICDKQIDRAHPPSKQQQLEINK
jgi:hypothetical protein